MTTAGTDRLQDVVRAVDANERTLSVYNFTGPEAVGEALAEYFETLSVELRRAATDDGEPKDFAVLHDGGEYVAASAVRDLYDAIRADVPDHDETHPDDIRVPAVLDGLDQTVFTSHDKPRMVGASRIVERTAWRHGEGELHAGFQRLSRVRSQWRLYNRLAVSGVETHLYGAPDWDLPPTDLHVHAADAEEITRCWFVVYEGPETQRALLAEERGPDRYYGFWTRRPSLVDAILDRLRTAYPATSTP